MILHFASKISQDARRARSCVKFFSTGVGVGVFTKWRPKREMLNKSKKRRNYIIKYKDYRQRVWKLSNNLKQIKDIQSLSALQFCRAISQSKDCKEGWTNNASTIEMIKGKNSASEFINKDFGYKEEPTIINRFSITPNVTIDRQLFGDKQFNWAQVKSGSFRIRTPGKIKRAFSPILRSEKATRRLTKAVKYAKYFKRRGR